MTKPKNRPATELADDQNARGIAPEALEGLGHTIAEYGDLGGVVFNRANGKLVSGNQRMDRFRAAGATTWEDHGDHGWIEHPTTGERFRIRIVEWDEAKHRAAQLVANNPEVQGYFTDKAVEQLAALADAGIDAEALRLDALTERLLAAEGLSPTDQANDPAAHWNGMPEFDQKDKTAFRSLVVHFKTPEDLEAFSKLVGQPITEKTRFLWYPFIEIERYADKTYE